LRKDEGQKRAKDMLTAIEITGTINANHQIVLDEELPSNAPSRVLLFCLKKAQRTKSQKT